MHQLGKIFAFVGLSLACAPAAADDNARRLTGDEIRSQILGHRFSGSALAENKAPLEIVSFFSTDGRLLTQMEDKDNGKPRTVFMQAFEIKEDRLCVHDLGLTRQTTNDECYEAYKLNSDDEHSWSGYLAASKDADRRIPLDFAYPVRAEEMETRWANWEGIRKEVGPIDGFLALDQIFLNPFRFKDRVAVIKGRFRQMIGDGRGLFRGLGRHTPIIDDFIVEAVPNALFRDDSATAVIVGVVSGSFRMTQEGTEVFLPVITAKAVRLCKTETCSDYFKGWD